jgi:transcriptional regulator with XRE-family HTH domain
VQDVQRHVGERIRELRTAAGYTQEIFAERAGLNRTHMSDIERGEANMTIQTLKVIADTLGVKMVELFKDW